MIYTLGQASKIVNRDPKTLQRWDRDGSLVAFRHPSGRRFYTMDQLSPYLPVESVILKRHAVGYCRVSSHSQKPDLKNQVSVVRDYCRRMLIDRPMIISEVGGGLNFRRKKFTSLIDDVVGGLISDLVIAHKDRLARFGYDLLEHLCQKNGTRLHVIDRQELSPENELVQDLMAITHCFSARLYGLRNYRKALSEALRKK
jgi:putative resolvase